MTLRTARQVALVLLLAASALSQTFAQPSRGAASPMPPLPTLVEQEVLLLQFIGGGSPLTASERAQATQIVREGVNDPEANWPQISRNQQREMAIVVSQDPVTTGALWDAFRYNYAFKSGAGPFRRWFPIEKAIIDAHDPVLYMDRQNQRIVTAYMLPALRRVGTEVAALYSLAPPRPDFATLVKPQLPTLSQFDASVADGVAHIVRYQPYLAPFLGSLSPSSRATLVNMKTSVFSHTDQPSIEQWQIAQAGAMQARFASQHAAGGAGARSFAYGQKMQNMWLGNAARSLSSGCNPGLSTADRAENNCLAPIPVPGVR